MVSITMECWLYSVNGISLVGVPTLALHRDDFTMTRDSVVEQILCLITHDEETIIATKVCAKNATENLA